MITLNESVNLQEFMRICADGEKVNIGEDAVARINKASEYIKRAGESGKAIYGVTTGLGANCEIAIDSDQTEVFQMNILRSHAVSVGKPMTELQTRALMLAIVVHGAKGYCGVRSEVLDRYVMMLNERIYPFVPAEGSVGYLAPEAHLALAAFGEGKLYIYGKLLDSGEYFESIGWKEIKLTYKEGLFLISGTTSATSLAAIGAYYSANAMDSADIIAALTIEMNMGNPDAYSTEVMSLRVQPYQSETAAIISKQLRESEIYSDTSGLKLQDALSLRCVPQVHGAAREKLLQSIQTVERELESCTDNPVLIERDGELVAYSSGNPDASYIGLASDCIAIADTMVAKMSERRSFRMLDTKLTGRPAFLVLNPGLNNGLMIPQYTQAGLLNQMKGLCMPSVVDSIPTCSNQEDYVSMGYNSCLKLQEVVEKLEYILAIELLTNYQLYQFVKMESEVSSSAKRVYLDIEKFIKPIENDVFLYDYIESIKEYIHRGDLKKIYNHTDI